MPPSETSQAVPAWRLEARTARSTCSTGSVQLCGLQVAGLTCLSNLAVLSLNSNRLLPEFCFSGPAPLEPQMEEGAAAASLFGPLPSPRSAPAAPFPQLQASLSPTTAVVGGWGVGSWQASWL